MKLKICNFCREEYSDSDFEGYCSEACEAQSKRSAYTTISIRHDVRTRIILLQNEILKKTKRKIPYSDLLDHLFDICEQECREKKLPEVIIDNYKYYL